MQGTPIRWTLATIAVALGLACGCDNNTVVSPDSGRPDGGPSSADGGSRDGGGLDAGTADAGAMDAGPADAGAPDTGAADAGPTCIPLPAMGETRLIPGELTETSARWMRPDDFCEVLDPSAFARDLHVFCPPATDVVLDVLLRGVECDDTLTLRDPFLVVYPGDGIPADPLSMCTAANGDPLSKWNCSATYELLVPAGTTLTAVATSGDPAELIVPGGGAGGGAPPGFGTYVLEVRHSDVRTE